MAVPLSRALDEISKSQGVVLKASPALKNEIVVVKVTDVPLETLKDKLAQAVVGEWTKSTDGIEYLGPSVSKRASLERADQQKRLEAITKALKRVKDNLTAKPASDPAIDMMDTSGDPSSKFAVQLSSGLRAAEIAAIPKGGRVVYSTAPNAMQKPLSVPNLANLTSQFVQDNNSQVHEEVDPVEGKDPAQEEKMAQVVKLMGISIPHAKKIDAPPAKILLIAERGGLFGGLGDSLSLHMVAFAKDGSVLANGSVPLESNFAGMAQRAMVEKEAGDEKSAPKQSEKHDPQLDKPIEFTPLTKELATLSNTVQTMQSDVAPSDALMQHILRPDLYDPLSYVFSESLIGLSTVAGQNLVAAIPDDAMDMSSVMRIGNKETTYFTFQESLKDMDSIQSTTGDGWTVVSLAHPVTSDSMRVDRAALAKLLGASQKALVPTLDAMADYAAVNPPIMETPVAMTSLMFVAPNAISMGMRGGQDWPMLRLYGLLGPAERDTLRQGRTLAFAGVPSKAQGILKQMVYGAGSRFQVGPEPEQVGLPFMAMAASMMGHDMETFKEEPTELLPTGLPAQGGISLKSIAGHFVMVDSKAGLAKFFGAMGPEEYSMIKYFSEEPKMAGAGAMMPKMDKLKVGERDTLDFRLHLAPDVSQKHTLMDHRIGKDAATVGPDALPADFMAEVEKQMKMFKEGFAPFLTAPGFGNNGVPPQ